MKKTQPKRLAALKLSAGEFNPEVIVEAIRQIKRPMVSYYRYAQKYDAVAARSKELQYKGTGTVAALREKINALPWPQYRNPDQLISTSKLLVAAFGSAALFTPHLIKDEHEAYSAACKHIRIAQQWRLI